MTTSTVLGVSFDAHDAAKVARFWADALGRRPAAGASAEDAIVVPGDDSSAGPTEASW